MAKITIEQGHYPRTKGATGTYREQALTRAIGTRLAAALQALGHVVALIGADQPAPRGDVFISLHGDSGNATVARRGASTRRGGSVGYPGSSSRLAAAWKRHHAAHGYPGGFHADNFTRNLSGYYRWARHSWRNRRGTGGLGYSHRFLAEHGTLTHAGDEDWLFANLDACVAAHVAAIGEVVGHPKPAAPPKPAEPRWKVAVRYAGGVDGRIARGLAATLHLHVASIDDPSTVGTVYLVGGEAVRRYDRSLAQHVIEVAGDGRDETLDAAVDIMRAYVRNL